MIRRLIKVILSISGMILIPYYVGVLFFGKHPKGFLDFIETWGIGIVLSVLSIMGVMILVYVLHRIIYYIKNGSDDAD